MPAGMTCTQIPYDTAAAAHDAAAAVNRRHPTLRLYAYRCTECHKHHLARRKGHPHKRKRRGRPH